MTQRRIQSDVNNIGSIDRIDGKPAEMAAAGQRGM
jgi:hypothetical protein